MNIDTIDSSSKSLTIEDFIEKLKKHYVYDDITLSTKTKTTKRVEQQQQVDDNETIKKKRKKSIGSSSFIAHDIYEAKTLCIVASSLFNQDHHQLYIHQYFISIIESQMHDDPKLHYHQSLSLFLDLYKNIQYYNYFIQFYLLKLISKQIEQLPLYNRLKDRITKLFSISEMNQVMEKEKEKNQDDEMDMDGSSSNNNHSNIGSDINYFDWNKMLYNELYRKIGQDCLASQQHIDLYLKLEHLLDSFSLLPRLIQYGKENNIDIYNQLLFSCCDTFDKFNLSHYSILIYQLTNDQSSLNDINWFKGINNIKSFRMNFVNNLQQQEIKTMILEDKEIEDMLTCTINRFCVPRIFQVTDKKRFIEYGLNRSELVETCWRFTVTRPIITYSVVMEIQTFLQNLSLSDPSKKNRMVIDLFTNSEKIRNDYFDRHNQDKEDVDEDDEELYDFEIELGIYILASLFYISSYRYFKFLITGSSFINQNQNQNQNNSNNNSNNSSRDIITIKDDNITTFDIKSGNPLFMIVHQVLFYSNADDNFKENTESLYYDKQLNEAIRHLTLCMDCYSDLNQEPWSDRFKSIFSKTWNSSDFYWINTSLADCHYYYESYSMALTFYKNIKVQLSDFQQQKTILSLGGDGDRLMSFNPTDDFWVNRLFLHLAMTNHSEIEESIVYLLETLVTMPLTDQFVQSQHTWHTIKPYFTSYTDSEVIFWCVDTLAACYERLGMVGEMTVLYQCYWSYYKSRFQKIIQEIHRTASTATSAAPIQAITIVDTSSIDNPTDDGVPLSNISKKDLRKGYFFPRFFDYISNIEMLEEFSLLLNQGYRLDILPSGYKVSTNGEIISMIEQHITTSTKKGSMSLVFLMNKFFNEELEHWRESKKKNNK
ncbi:hypothetical protein DFA_08177 [Cavenderia fasciculata]|uniref:Uncharacterized protein n=1 Tax=Cavenderia fasciculata TaxID=261658 RepID=F4Q5D1_CACFS|nr:uncharacterized protein DFA_08177 [Cavenderia fasciculata]EGG17190.1 hypothetical protein DFA_08177 [Cavenderia fasciculata]|eukprot:XP_004355674.1 hypothetical protein DFA_08177 [Cavenderia fasciculata]